MVAVQAHNLKGHHILVAVVAEAVAGIEQPGSAAEPHYSKDLQDLVGAWHSQDFADLQAVEGLPIVVEDWERPY